MTVDVTVAPEGTTAALDSPAKPRRGLLRRHDFRQLFLADGGSQIGTQIGMLALPLVAAVTLHATPLQMGFVAAGNTVPLLLATLPAGALADRMRRRKLMIICDLGRMVAMAVIPIAWWQGRSRDVAGHRRRLRARVVQRGV